MIATGLRAATAALVEKQSSEMLELINEARSEYMQQESLYLDEGVDYIHGAPPSPYPSRAPPPHPPALAKYHLYNDPLEFADIDQIAISVSFSYPCSLFLVFYLFSLFQTEFRLIRVVPFT